jgi:hypothetical protein
MAVRVELGAALDGSVGGARGLEVGYGGGGGLRAAAVGGKGKHRWEKR